MNGITGYRCFPDPNDPGSIGEPPLPPGFLPFFTGICDALLAMISLASSRPHCRTKRSYFFWTLNLVSYRGMVFVDQGSGVIEIISTPADPDLWN